MAKSLPFVSVVIACYNGEATVGACLESLLRQTYPKDRYEIIVIDDGSTDDTAAAVAAYPSVRCVRLDKNYGIPTARNAGLKEVKGTIYAAFDCDCRAYPDWLSNLVQGYQDGKAIGVGAVLVEPEPIRRLATRYISVCDTLFAPVDDDGAAGGHKLPHQRLLNYLKAKVRTRPATRRIRKVPELYGAIGSFPMDILHAVGGWDESLNGIEDRDICERMRHAFPGRPFYQVTDAKIVHERGESLWHYLMRPVKRGPVNFEFHRRNKLAPPIFPFPLLYVVICLGAVVFSPLAGLILMLGLPQLLYFWWPYKAAQRRQSILLVFPYIQLLEESMVIIGLLKGWLAFIQRRQRRA
jgi:glycosyltransferase involved in cell wall biosynthesis